jgi:hypothetical protein
LEGENMIKGIGKMGNVIETGRKRKYNGKKEVKRVT